MAGAFVFCFSDWIDPMAVQKVSVILKHPQLRWLAAASVPADLADWLDYVAVIALLAFQWQAGPWALAGFAIAIGLPYLVIGPLAGAIVDRTNLRRVLILANLGRALATAMLIFAPNAVAVLAIVFLRASVDSAFTPARQAAIQALAQKDQLEAANGLVHAIKQITKIVGPALGGALLVVAAPQWIFGINACLSLLAAVLVWGVVTPQKTASGQPASALFGEVFEGFMEVRRNPLLLTAMGFMALSFFAIFMYDTFFALLVQDFGFEASVYGFAIAAAGGGGVLGAVLAASISFGAHHLRIMAIGATIAGAGVLIVSGFSIFGWSLPKTALFAGFFIFALASAFVMVAYRSVLQREAAADKMARVAATGEAFVAAAMLSAPLLGGFLIQHFSIGVPFAIGGGLQVVAGLAVLVWGRRFQRPEKT